MKYRFLLISTIILLINLAIMNKATASNKPFHPLHVVMTEMWAYGDTITHATVLDYKQNNLRFYVSCKERKPSKDIEYQYRLLGAQDNWSKPTNMEWTFFTDLVPGDYVFQVRCRDHHNIWGETASHAFTIDNPWWRTWWAKLIYIVITMSVVVYITHLMRTKLKLNEQLRIEREIKQFRTNYVIQTSRELRTPLTIIRSTVEKLKTTQESKLSKTDIQHLRNSSSMLMKMVENLVNFKETDKRALDGDMNDILEMTEVPINQQTVVIMEQDEQLADVLRRDILGFMNVVVIKEANLFIERMMEIRPAAVVIDTELNDANGYELLHEYKQRQELTHIPAIIISDFDNDRSLIRAIKSEADDYLQKPFNSKVLTVMLIKKIKMCLPAITGGDCQQEVAKDEPQNDPTSTYDEKNIILEKRSDKRFISLLNILIANNLSNADFDVNLLAEMMKISRGQLYRKIKELYDVTPVEYLRRKRLSHAAELIEESNMTIQEIMLHVGMPDATNFYKRFKEMYGMNPTEYRNR